MGTVISEVHRRHRAIEFRKFLVRIGKAVSADLDVHPVCDNSATHHRDAPLSTSRMSARSAAYGRARR
jgi:hypothetical protein